MTLGRVAAQVVAQVVVLACAWVAPAFADTLALRIGRMGEVEAQEAGPPEPPRPGNVVGSTPVFAPRFIRLGPQVEGVYCRQFGLEFRATNLPPDAEVPVTVQLRHPLWTLPDGRTSTMETNLSGVAQDRWTYTGYTLEEPWSLVPGQWIFTITQGVRVLATASFNLEVEPNQTEPQGGCTSPTS